MPRLGSQAVHLKMYGLGHNGEADPGCLALVETAPSIPIEMGGLGGRSLGNSFFGFLGAILS